MSYTLYNSIKRPLIPVLLLSIALSFCGCAPSIYSNYREISRLHVVQTLGLDKTSSQLGLTATTGVGAGDQLPLILSRKGESIVATLNALQEYSPKDELYFPHTLFVVLGEDAAKQSLPELLDYLGRSSSLRMDISLFIVKGGDAEELISGTLGKNYDITGCLSAIERDVRRLGVGYVFNCREVARSLSEYGSGLIYAVSPAETEGFVFSESSELTALPAGYGIIKDDALCAFMGPELSMGANLLLNKSGIGSLDVPDGQGGLASMSMGACKTVYSARWDSAGKLHEIVADITVSAGIAALSSPIDLTDPSVLDNLSHELSDEIERRSSGVLELSQELESDFLGLMGFMRQKYPREVRALQGDFVNALKTAELTVNVSAKVQRSYDLESPAKTRGEGGKNA